ncbi:uncharacterized protein LOC114575495 [Rhizophagus irregularis DAOM 181602=DAOM 197198]|nr:uncharacterized protein LOC114575495 [Rhizophagus irregularis DAOM 181602=DAOM 197198]
MNVNKRRDRTRTKEKCYCNKCNGKYVDPRTKQKHLISLSLDDATTSNDPMSIESSFVNEEISIDPQESTSSSENLSTFSSKRRKRSSDDGDNNDDNDDGDDGDDNDDNDDNDDGDDSDDNDDGDDSDDNDDGDDSDDNDDGDDNFPTSLYTARKKLGLKHQFVKFSVCPLCHKLHNIDEVKQHTIQQHKAIKKCDHVQFPNHRSLRQCNAPLSEQKELDDSKVVNAPLLIYPMPSIKEQLLQMYQRPNFEKNLKLWADRSVNDRVLCDVYDGEIWKNFSNSGIIVDDESDEQRFFNKEHADDHLGIASFIVKRLWLGHGKINMEDLTKI